jgi:hypothetical protein
MTVLLQIAALFAALFAALGSAACSGAERKAENSSDPVGTASGAEAPPTPNGAQESPPAGAALIAPDSGPPSAALPADAPDRDVDSLLAAIRACPRDGLWHTCSIERRLQMSGLRAIPIDTATTIPGLSPPALTWQVGRQQMRAVLFATAAEAEQAVAALDPVKGTPRADPTASWPGRVTLVHSANLVALYFGGSDRQVERVVNALSAGAPQPPE